MVRGQGVPGVNRDVVVTGLDRPVSLFGVVVRAVSSASARFPRSSVTLLELPKLPHPILVSGPAAGYALNKAFEEMLSGRLAEVKVAVRYAEQGVVVVEISSLATAAAREVWLSVVDVVDLDSAADRDRSRRVPGKI
jgi:hypothetical protein